MTFNKIVVSDFELKQPFLKHLKLCVPTQNKKHHFLILIYDFLKSKR